MMKKGISLAIDTTIIIILAVVVLAVLIGIFFLVAGPTQDEFKARLTQSQVCGAYRNVDIDCDGKEYSNYAKDNENLLKELATACTTLKISGCSGTADIRCIKACCPGCGAAKAKCESEISNSVCRRLPGGCNTGPPFNEKQVTGDCSHQGSDYVCCQK